ncbi:M16 family metallopeptidase [Kitasatospora paranensis]|uniref:M16 family metallopeptidase n=1 Tax=Kitasatospora paranensis TaxID=258053 RepID=A0ABW2G8B1_9ACTN
MVTHTEVDGIETVLAPMSGPLRAGLMFRVGRADETLATAGITHLVEHLALHRHGLADFHYNGATAATETHFLVQGTPAEVVSYLNGVCAALRDLPLDRLDVEKEILRTEAAGRGTGSRLPLWRHGAQSYGLLAFPEFGLHRIGAEEVTDWAAEWFTRQNCVLWITADELPEGLSLTLPEGERRAAPEATSALPQSPAYFTGEEAGVVLHAVVERSTAAQVFADLLGRALFRELRQEGGLSYQAAGDYSPRDGGSAVVTAVADALPAKREAVLGGFVDVLAALRMGRIEPAELDSVRNRALEELNSHETEAAGLPGLARDLLLGRPAVDRDRARAAVEALTVADMRRVAGEVWDAALLMTPSGTSADWAGFHAAPTTSGERVAGRHWPSLAREGFGIVIGDDGVSMVGPDGQATVRYDACAAVLTLPDGARRLIGTDAITVDVEPTLYGIPAGEIARIDAALPPTAVVPLPARSADRIPQPPAGKARGGVRGGVRSGIWYGALADRFVNASDPLLGVAFLCLLGTLAAGNAGDTPVAVALAIGVLLAAGPLTAVRTVRRIHARR